MTLLRLRFVLLCALACFALPASAAPPRNLLANPGFEDGVVGHPWMPASWDTSVSGLPSVFFGRDTLLAHGGRYSADVANVSTLLYMAHNWSQRLLVTREMWGKDLVFSVWTRSNGLTGRAYLLAQAYRDTISKMAGTWNVPRDSAANLLRLPGRADPAMLLGWERRTFDEQETDWVRREVRIFIPPTTNVVFVRVGLFGTGQVLLDDASVTLEPARPAKAPRAGENLLANGGFESGTQGWEISMAPYPGMRIESDSTAAHDGRKSVRMESGAGDYVTSRTGICQGIANRALAGKRVRLTAWVRTDSLRSSTYTKIYCHTPRGVAQVPQGEPFGATPGW